MTEGNGDQPIGPKSGGDPGTTAFVDRINVAGGQGTARLADLLQQGKAVDEVLEELAGMPLPEHARHWLGTADNGSKFLAALQLVSTVGQRYGLRLRVPGEEIRVILGETRTTIQVVVT